MDEIEDQPLKLGVPVVAVMLATVLLAGAIIYNALWRQSRSGQLPIANHEATVPSLGQGSMKVVVDLSQLQPTTVTLRYDPVVEAVQRELAASGIYSGPIDGVSGRRTGLAILAYQRMQGLDLTGVATPELVDHIQLTRQFAAAADTTGSLAPDYTGDSVRGVQRRLKELGYDPGAIDGGVGAQTQIAIRRFEQDRGMRVTGRLSEALVAELGKSGPRTIAVSR
jgi:peptidoglycan hydrolase-like protein with peptidoglycan-binding domain